MIDPHKDPTVIGLYDDSLGKVPPYVRVIGADDRGIMLVLSAKGTAYDIKTDETFVKWQTPEQIQQLIHDLTNALVFADG